MHEYRVVINGIEHTIQLSDAEAKAKGLYTDRASKSAPAPDAGATATAPPKKARTVANKARTVTPNKT